jgi:hypothetical protein
MSFVRINYYCRIWGFHSGDYEELARWFAELFFDPEEEAIRSSETSYPRR